MRGTTHGLGFLFLYGLLQGSTKATCISSAGWGQDFGRNDGHRLGVLCAQLFADKALEQPDPSLIP